MSDIVALRNDALTDMCVDHVSDLSCEIQDVTDSGDRDVPSLSQSHVQIRALITQVQTFNSGRLKTSSRGYDPGI